MLSPKENALKLFRHENPEYIPKYGEGIINNRPIDGYHERPEGGKGGYDWFGVEWTFAPGDVAPMPSSNYLLEDVCDWEEVVKFPNLDEIDWEEAARKDRVDAIDRENNLHIQMIHNGVFERLNTLMGMENSLCALLTDPEECKAFFDACADYKCKLIEKMHKYYKMDMICYHDDWGTQKNMMFSPDIWSELIKPATKKIVEFTKSLGIIFELHSDGMIKDIVPELVDEVKPDAIQIMAINDIPALKKITGNRVVYDVFVDVQKFDALETAGQLTEELLRSELRKDFYSQAEGGCYLPSIYMVNPKWAHVVDEEFEAMRMDIYK